MKLLRKTALLLLMLPAVLVLRDVLPAEAYADRIYVRVQDCGPDGKARPTFVWTGHNPQAAYQWLDLSLHNNGWLPGTYIVGGPLKGGTDLMGHPGLEPGTVYYLRHVEQRLDGTHDVSPTYMFTTIRCPGAPRPATTDSTSSQPSAPVTSQPSRPGTTSATVQVAPTTGTNCHPSYHGACLQQGVGDYDCIGQGDGPNYVRGPIYLDGPDEFGLDDDGDNIACER